MKLIPRYKCASQTVLLCLVFFIQSYDTLSQLQMQIPPQASVYSGATRGYWFEAPADFTIVGLRVPTDASSASQNIAVVRFNGGAPPLYSSTTNNFTILALYQAVQGNSIISVNLPISDGDYIGVLGSRGGNSTNSYGANNYSTNIGGYPVTLGRLGMQYDLQSTSPINLWRENYGSISRVELYYSTAGIIAQDSILACNVDSTQLSPDSSWSSYAWSTGDTTQTTYVSNSGLYYLTVTDMSGNPSTDSVYVNISNPFTQASIIPTDCESTANGVITASGFGGHSPYQYIWSNGSTSASINTLATGFYGLTITDSLGCQNDSLLTLSALDTIPPSISTQNISVYLDAYGEANITASQINNASADNCGIDSFAINFSAFDCDDAGVNVVILTAWDTSGNSSSATANVTVSDTTPPSISTQNISIYLDANGEANITASQINNGSADNCGIDSFAINLSTFDCSDTGLNVVTLIAFDASGNVSDSATASLSIVDTIPPSISTQNISVYLDAYGEANITASQINNASADNCGIDSFAINFSAFDCDDAGVNVVILTAWDTSGNSSSATANVTVSDTTPPSISTQNISIYLDANGEANITASQINNGSADNCEIDSFAINFNAFDCDDAGVNVVTLTAWDTNGNSSTAASNVTVLDTTPPSISTQNISVYLDANGEANITASQINNASADNCGIDSFAINSSAFDCDDAGVNVVTLTAWDVNGNSSSAAANVTILDTLSPIILANHDTIFLDSFGQAILTSSAIDAGTFDNCTLLYTDVSDSLFGCSDVNNAHLVWFIASDIFGNTDSAPKSIYVKDEIAPEIICLDTISRSNDSGQCGAVVQFTEPTAFDNCSIDMMNKFDSTGLDSGMFFPVGITELSYAVFDQSGNSDTCSIVVEVIDTQPPILLCVPDTQICDSIFTFNLPNYFDNCSELDIQHFEGPASGTFHPVGTTVHRFSILDPSGNSDTCSFEVLRYDYPSIAEAGDNQKLCEEISIDIEGNTPAVGNGYWTKITGNGIIADTNLSNTTFADFGYGITLVSWNIENGVCPVESDTISINNFSDSASINAGFDIIICDTSSTILNSVKPEIGSYYWNSPLNGASISDTGITNPTVTGLEVGDYEFVWSVINGSCPPGADTVTVSIKPEPVIVSSDSSYIFASSIIDIGASSDIPVNYSWFDSSFAIIDSGNTIKIRPKATETYIVQGITEFGCVSFDSVYIQVNESLEIPSAFTPDEDGFNDVWNLKELASYPKCEVRIFNRWGHTLFESTGYDTPWDGTVNGEKLPGGAYFFVIDLKVSELNPLTGSITIIK